MKKWIALLLALVLLSMTACGAQAATETAVESAGEAPAAEEAAEAPAAQEEAEVSAEDALGTKVDNVYASGMLGIRADFGDDWTILSDEEVAQVMGYTADSISDKDLAELLRNSGSTCDLYAMANDQSGDNVNIQLEDLGIIYGIALNEQKYAELAAPQLEKAFGQMGVSNIKIETGTYSFAGKDRVSLQITGETNGMTIYERMVLIKSGKYMATITAFSLQESSIDTVLNRFEAAA